MHGIPLRTLIALVLFVAAARAGNNDPGPAMLPDDIDSYLAHRTAIPADFRATEQRPLHAMFPGEEPNWFHASGGVWVGQLSGPVKFDGGTVLDVSDAFGLDGTSAIPFVRFGLRLWRFELILEGWWYASDGTAVVEEEFEIDGVVFEVGDVIESRVTFSSYRLALGYQFWRAEAFSGSFLLGLSLINTTGNVTATSADKTATWDEWIPLPAIGINCTGTIWRGLIYEFEGNWIGFSTSTFTATAWDVRAAIGWQFKKWILARVGYRYLSLEGEIDAIGVEIELDGVYVEVAFTF